MLTYMSELKGKTAVVTGGARGLGAAVTLELADAGADVVILDIREDTARTFMADAPLRIKSNLHFLLCDVTSPPEVTAMLDRILVQFGAIDVLVNNAAIDKTAPIGEIDPKEWDRIITTNLSAPFYLTRAVFPIMAEKGGGAVINIASTASKRAWEYASAYHASKWGLLGLSYALHTEGRRHNIRVTAVVCGGMRTPFLLDRFPDISLDKLQDPANVAKTIRFVLNMPAGSVIPEVMVLPMKETSFP